MRTITLTNQSKSVSASSFAAAVAALRNQVLEHFGPAWGLTATVQADAGPGVPAGEVIFVLDDTDTADALGYHDLVHGWPTGYVFARTTEAAGQSWTVTASHELLEQLADPWASCASIGTWAGRPAALAWECCDPVEGDAYLIDRVLVSNFILPAWFGGGVARAKVDYLGKLRGPLQMTAGGYVSYCRQLGHWQEALAEKHGKPGSGYSRHVRRQHGRPIKVESAGQLRV